ncbi:MAG: ABC transporter ATP-binding protein [uncultured bacterium]|uniref:ABC transporter family protein n=2 Tax=Candidatus Wolfeibacteriota TaxID=1752735 RepID=A0A0G1H7Q1_9BACT|nr:MAG: ABC transporter ATP-binding protein [uncultured bacterium]KKR12463.1 MAG: ABC transporter family protein [Candidatus Wolfebacteria bacterium GW2011_GWC2_39_22]KKT43416.1 MAG: ABC transporter family protein [Candidatus Wolfebacteria bacterium GW2011_GWE2_44_13]HBI25857.1 sulfonate ABC transporter ATP-binding protein [Candidatus Wolfebacteria bacterium]
MDFSEAHIQPLKIPETGFLNTMITVKNLHIAYANTGHEALRDISFDVRQGERVAILGPSGCGKTTILHAIAGLLQSPTIIQKGSITIAGQARIGMVFQHPTLLPWKTVAQNIAYGSVTAGKPTTSSTDDALLQMIGLQKFKQYYPEQLSLGMQQRVNFARALSIQPDLLLMDEPFSGLDIATKKSIQDEFKAILEKTRVTTLFVTHSLSEATFLADRIVILSAGPGTVQTIMVNKPGQHSIPEYQYIDNDEE